MSTGMRKSSALKIGRKRKQKEKGAEGRRNIGVAESPSSTVQLEWLIQRVPDVRLSSPDSRTHPLDARHAKVTKYENETENANNAKNKKEEKRKRNTTTRPREFAASRHGPINPCGVVYTATAFPGATLGMGCTASPNKRAGGKERRKEGREEAI